MRETPSVDARAALIEERLIGSPVARRLGIRLVSVGRAGATLALPFDAANVTTADTVHGGVIATLADVAGVASAVVAAGDLPKGGATSNLAIGFLAPARGADLRAIGTVLHVGRNQTVARVEVTTDDGKAIDEALVTVGLY